MNLLPIATKCITVDMGHTIGNFVSELLTLTEISIVDKVTLPIFCNGCISWFNWHRQWQELYLTCQDKATCSEKEVTLIHFYNRSG